MKTKIFYLPVVVKSCNIKFAFGFQSSFEDHCFIHFRLYSDSDDNSDAVMRDEKIK